MTRLLSCSLLLVGLISSVAEAQVTASSYSTGGTAISTARGTGNTRLNASAFASRGGYARATMTGRGTNGGFASGSSQASSIGGVAISDGRSVANGWGARSDARSSANSYYGFARSNGTAIANGPFAQAGADARARAIFNYSRSDARAVDNRSWATPVTSSGPATSTPVSGFGSANGYGNSVGSGFSGGSMSTQVITSGRRGGSRSFGSRAAAFIRGR